MTAPINIEVTRWRVMAKPDPTRQALGEVWYETETDPGRAWIHVMETGDGKWAYASSKREPDPAARLPWSDAILDDLREFFLAAEDQPWPALVLHCVKIDGLPDILEAVCSLCGEIHKFIDYDNPEFEPAICESPILDRRREARMPRLMPLPAMDQLPKWERGEMQIRLTIGNAAETDLGELAARVQEINAKRFGRA